MERDMDRDSRLSLSLHESLHVSSSITKSIHCCFVSRILADRYNRGSFSETVRYLSPCIWNIQLSPCIARSWHLIQIQEEKWSSLILMICLRLSLAERQKKWERSKEIRTCLEHRVLEVDVRSAYLSASNGRIRTWHVDERRGENENSQGKIRMSWWYFSHSCFKELVFMFQNCSLSRSCY